MQLLVFAQPPPPIHGQSLMVRTLIEGLPGVAPEITLHLVNPRLSRDHADIGRWRLRKLLALFMACARALRRRARHGARVLYYVPAPAKRGALYRDWLVMLLCRPFFSQLVLHWHAVGLGEWLVTRATAPERWITRALLGRADLALVLAPELMADAQRLAPRRITVVPNGINVAPNAIEVGRDRRARRTAGDQPSPQNVAPMEVLFLGLGGREKGLFDTLTALAIANRRVPHGFRLTVAGSFPSAEVEHAFRSQAATLGAEVVRHVGFADSSTKAALFAQADVLCFPTRYAHEGQPLTLIESLAYDLPIITTRWRAIPGMLPPEHVWFVEPGRPDQIADALLAAGAAGLANGKLRQHYLAHFTRERHLAALAAALSSVGRRPAL